MVQTPPVVVTAYGAVNVNGTNQCPPTYEVLFIIWALVSVLLALAVPLSFNVTVTS